MASLRARVSATALRHLLRPALNNQSSPEHQRAATERVARLQFPPRHLNISEGTLGGRPCEWLRTEHSNDQRVLLHLHGGAYVVGSPRTHRTMCGYLAQSIGCKTAVLDYRLAPEHPFPAALDDAIAAYKALLEKHQPEQIAISGDSAGAGLTLALCFSLRELGLAQPACISLFCPFGDLNLNGESMQRNRAHEPLLTREWLAICGEYYAADQDPMNPKLSPQFGDFRELPPMLIQAAAHDLLLDDARAIHKSAQAAGVDSKLEVFAELGHDFQLSADIVPEARKALTTAGAYMKVRMQ